MPPYNFALQIFTGMWHKLFFIVWCIIAIRFSSSAQDPALPSTNLGMANMQDGVSPGPGLYYVHYLQVYQPARVKGPGGNTIDHTTQVSSFLSMHQFIYESSVKVLNGHLAFSLLIPLVKLSASNDTKPVLVNPGVPGGLIFGPVIQWSNKTIFRLPYSHRAEIDLSMPVGAYNKKYDINPSSRCYTLTAYYAFTLFLTKNFSISNRHNINYNFRQMTTGVQPGMFYNLNFSLEPTLFKTVRAELAGYYLKQLVQDAYLGNHHYYQETFGISDTREQVLALGPGLSYVSSRGLAAELKVFIETQSHNRAEGVRPTLKLAYKLH